LSEFKKRKRLFQRKKYNRKKRAGLKDRMISYFKTALVLAIIPVLSLLCIFGYDFLTQCDYFRAKTLEVENNNVLTKEEIIKASGINLGDNILSVNISTARKKIMANPWVAEAEVGRKIPSGITVKITEHSCLAVIDLGKEFLLNENGEIFKEKADTDPVAVPMIKGLTFSDLNANGAGKSPAFNAVFSVLKLGQKPESVLPNGEVKLISVDREIGVTIHAFNEMKTIKLGYDNYKDKYERLKNVLHHFNNGPDSPDFETVDLNNSLNRVVVKPAVKKPSEEPNELRIQTVRGIEEKETKEQKRAMLNRGPDGKFNRAGKSSKEV
jgi:cell division protein FtsQ